MPDPAYTIDECISRLDTICGIYGAYNWEASLLHHLRAAQANADRIAALETLYTAAKAEHEALVDEIFDEELDALALDVREALRALGPLKEPTP